MGLFKTPEWGVKPIQDKHKMLGGLDYFILWSSLGVGLLVFSAGSFLSAASFFDAMLAIIVGSVAGSVLLSLAGKIGSNHGIPSLISMRPSFGIRGSYLPAILNVMQLVGWTTFEIMIMARAAEMLAGSVMPYYFWAAIFGALVALLGIAGPLNVARQWLGKFAVWIAYGTSAIIIISLINSTDMAALISSPGQGMSFFSALDLVIAMPVSWMPLVADYNRFAKKSKSAMWGTFIGFAMTNILFYFGGVLIGTSDVIGIIVAIQAMFFGFLMLLLIVDEADKHFLKNKPKIPDSRVHRTQRDTCHGSFYPELRSFLAPDRGNFCAALWCGAHRLLPLKETKIHSADAIHAAQQAWYRRTRNNRLGPWSPNKLSAVATVADLHAAAASNRRNNSESSRCFTHLLRDSAVAATEKSAPSSGS
ncbi:MAG: hypothetical protein E6K85_02080 [Thaumarchaeota archaeon]|nr:MAG: hypothetical protein E6K85_02080 [Nitrososphaerota archaeon]